MLKCLHSPLDSLSTFETAERGDAAHAPARYAVRQVLDQEHQKYLLRQAAEARQARFQAGSPPDGATRTFDASSSHTKGKDGLEAPKAEALEGVKVKRDFFGRIIVDKGGLEEAKTKGSASGHGRGKGNTNRIWVSYHEGFSNAVRKPITIQELMKGL
jgi:chromosome transmission fidelity protein 18